MIVKYKQNMSKQLPNLPILRNNHEANLCGFDPKNPWRIKLFWDIISNLIKSDNKLRWEIRDFNIFEKITQRRIYGIKNHSIWIKICGEIKERITYEFLNAKREKFEIISKII